MLSEFISYKIEFYDDQEAPEKVNEIIVMDSYFCLTAILWTINQISAACDEDSLDRNIVFGHLQYLSLIALRISASNQSLIEKEYILKLKNGGQNNA